MKILFLSRKWPPAMGGMETWAAELTAELGKDHDLDLHVLPGNPDGSAPGVLALLKFSMRTAASVAMRKGEVDVIKGGDLAVWPLVVLAGLRLRGARRALAAHGTDASFAARPGIAPALYRFYMRIGARLMPEVRVVANSAATADAARALGFHHVAVVPLATRAGHPAPPEPDMTLLFPGRILPLKGLSWFVREVLPALPEGLTLEVAGTVWDREEARVLDAPRVHYLGKLEQDELHSRMARARAVVLPNIPASAGHFEGFGLVAVEAAAAGAVVLAARLGGYKDSVRDGETGSLVAPQSAADWIEAIERVMEMTPEARRAWTSTAQAAVARHFTWDRVARDTLAAWEVPDR